jgi:hypothetical protein
MEPNKLTKPAQGEGHLVSHATLLPSGKHMAVEANTPILASQEFYAELTAVLGVVDVVEIHDQYAVIVEINPAICPVPVIGLALEKALLKHFLE